MGIQKIRLSQVGSRNQSKFNNLGDEILSMSVPAYEEFNITNHQTELNLTNRYVLGNNSLKVFVNGIYQEIGEQNSYVEVNEHTIRFNSSLEPGDWVMIRIEGAGSATTLADHIHINREPLYGAVNGSNRTFTLKYEPRKGTEMVYKNGVLQSPGGEDYVIDGKIIVFNEAPSASSKLVANYII